MLRHFNNFARQVSTVATAIPLAGCNWSQSILAPYGSHAETIDRLTWPFFIGGTLIVGLVAGLVAAAILLRRELKAWMANSNFIIGFGIVFPVMTLTTILTYSSVTSRTLFTIGEPEIRIEVIGEQFWWRVRYLPPDGEEVVGDKRQFWNPSWHPCWTADDPAVLRKVRVGDYEVARSDHISVAV